MLHSFSLDNKHVTHDCISTSINQWFKGYPIDHFTVVCLVAWPLNEGEAGVDLALIETLLFLC